MEELYSIMEDFLEVEYNQESLICLLKSVGEAYADEKTVKVELVVNGAQYYLKALQEELKTAISRMDSYIEENAKKQ